MIEPGTGLTILGTAVGSAKLLEKLLGPTADYLGEEIKELTKKKVTNLSNIFKNAEHKIGEGISKPGGVPPKVLKGILSEGPWCEEELQIEYFGGVLASSRSGISRDDRGAYFTSLIARLSTYQLRSHYISYLAFKKLFDGSFTNQGLSSYLKQLEIFIPLQTYFKSMDFNEEEIETGPRLISHAFWGLVNENLISTYFYGPPEAMNESFMEDILSYPNKIFMNAIDRGIKVAPSALGFELMMWAYGHGRIKELTYFDRELELPDNQNLDLQLVCPTRV
ncbi:MAG: hypothetical protein COW65_09685 [Cytophagales bacterium CG18_big_fil_WC_8_21_14_2_50_42_9]|nr:MAG: hypothetical protein COW65_09685 [Cytophagales bacterium CG18_big_fil_WC_8_21_14_2_50_42_9]